MSEKNLKKQSETNRDKLEAMTDKEIDVSDIPPLDESFFAGAKLRLPKKKTTDKIFLDRKPKSA
jgi:hypothetical protein